MTLHPEAAAFLRAIADAPAEDTPRLAFADWLEEHGEPERAEFIRVQMAIVRCPKCGGTNSLPVDGITARIQCCECAELRRRERDLLEAHCFSWFRQQYDLCGYSLGVSGMEFGVSVGHRRDVWFRPHRGFLSRVRCDWNSCSAHLDSILADPWVPGLDEVELTTWPELQQVGSDDEYLAGRPTDSYRDDGGWELLLQQRWPAVRSWKLPPETRGEPIITPAAQEIIDAAREIVRRAELDVGAIWQDIPPAARSSGPTQFDPPEDS